MRLQVGHRNPFSVRARCSGCKFPEVVQFDVRYGIVVIAPVSRYFITPAKRYDGEIVHHTGAKLIEIPLAQYETETTGEGVEIFVPPSIDWSTITHSSLVSSTKTHRHL